MIKYHLLEALKGKRHIFTAKIMELDPPDVITVTDLKKDNLPVYATDMVPLELRRKRSLTAHIDAAVFTINTPVAAYGVPFFYETQRIDFKATVRPPYKTKPVPVLFLYDGLMLAKFTQIFPEAKQDTSVDIISNGKKTSLLMLYSLDKFHYSVKDKKTGKVLESDSGPITPEIQARYDKLLND